MNQKMVNEDAGILAKGKLSFKSTLKEARNYKELAATPYGLKPILVFTAVGAVGAFANSVFVLSAPEIIRELDLKVFPLFTTFRLISLVSTVSIIAIAYLADRGNRVFLMGAGIVGQGLSGLIVARSTGLGSIGVGLLGENLGHQLYTIPTASIIADYYPPYSRGKVFALSGVLTNVFASSTPVLVALIVTAWGWRSPYYVTAPTLVLLGLFVMFRLQHPIRGYMERKALGADEEVAREGEEAPSIGEAFRTIWSIRTLRRLFIASIPSRMGITIFGFFFNLYFFERYGLDLIQRGLLFASSAAAAIPFGFLAGGIVDVLLRRRPQRVLIFSGLLSVAASILLFLIAAGPPLWILASIFILFGASSALIGPAESVLHVQILPAHVRVLGTAVIALAVIPATILQFFVIGPIEAEFGIQGALMVGAPVILLGALIQLSAAGFYEGDMRSAMASQLAGEEYRQAKKSGRGKILVCRDVDVAYDGIQVLFGVDFDVEEGEFIAVLGTNGAGKSTLLKAISGSQEASSGAVVFDGREITHMPPSEVAARGVIHMPGGRGVFPGLSVKENLALGGWTEEGDDVSKRLQEVLQIFPVLRERMGEKAGLLSGGEQQMLSLAQAFLSKPRLLMIDELSLGLSPAVVAQLIDIVKKINEQGTAVILVEQSVNVALTVAERAIFMEKGEIRFLGKTEDLLSRPDILRAVYVKGTGSLTEGAPAGAVKGERESRQYKLSTARTILEVNEAVKRFGGIVALDGASFSLKEGEILGVIGPNGAGKTTMFDIIGGQQPADSGSVVFDGEDITNVGAAGLASKKLIRRFQDARLFPSLTVYENILMALDQKLESRNMVFVALQLPQVRRAERRIRVRADRLIELLRLEGYRDKFVKELSTGLRRIVDLACVLATEPKLLLLDEPSTGIAQAESESLGPLLRRIRFETGCSMLVIEHDMTLISNLADELLAMHQGKVVARGLAEEVLNDETVVNSYLGTTEATIRRSGALT